MAAGELRSNPYRTLGVDRRAPPEVIAAAYDALVAKCIGTAYRGSAEVEGEAMLEQLHAAFAVLSDPDKRRQYDWRALARRACFVGGAGVALLGGIVATNLRARAAHQAAGEARPHVPDVPALIAGEKPPSDRPNYFEKWQLSSGTIVAEFHSCQEKGEKADSDTGRDVIASYCACMADATRHNFSAAIVDIKGALPTIGQLRQCWAAARVGDPSPFAFDPPRSTSIIVDEIDRCRREVGPTDHDAYCPCVVDMLRSKLKDSLAQISVDDSNRCWVVDRYLVATENFLTVRQFEALDISKAGR